MRLVCENSHLGGLIGFVLCLISSAVSAGMGPNAQSGANLSLGEVVGLIPQIEASERHLRNLKVDSEAWVETKMNQADPWQRSPIYVSASTWFEGVPRQKERIDVHKQVSEWLQGAAPYYQETYLMAFDGQNGRVASESSGYNGMITADKRGEILPRIPPRMVGGIAAGFTGARFSLYYFFSDNAQFTSFSDFLRKVTSPGLGDPNAFRYAVEEFQGVQCVTMESTRGRDKVRSAYWLDPSHGFALRGYELVNIRADGSEWLVSRIIVSKLKEAAPGAWWPVEASDESSPPRKGEPYKRLVYHAMEVVANQTPLDDRVFTIPFTEGYLVDDKVDHVKFKIIKGERIEQRD